MMHLTVNRTSISIVQGDITKVRVDAIVNAANNHLWMGGGVAGAIKRAGGSIIEEEALGKAPIPVGEAVATGAGRLAARYVIHAAGMGTDLKTDENKVRLATKNSLLLAKKLELESIALPSIGTGVGGFPLERAASIMLNCAFEHALGNTPLRSIVFVLWGKDAYDAFEKVLLGRMQKKITF